MRPRLHTKLNSVHPVFSLSKHSHHSPLCLWLLTLFLILTSVKYSVLNTIIPLLIQLKDVPPHTLPFSEKPFV